MIKEGAHKSQKADAKVALQDLCADFVPVGSIMIGAELVAVEGLPEWHRELLVHQDHMTTRLQRAYGGPVDLSVLNERLEGERYARYILLREPSGSVVEVGICRVDLRQTPPAARAEILERKAPLGDILIRHDVLRRIEPRWYWRFFDGSQLLSGFGRECSEAFGRVAVIHCNGEPAIELLEIVNQPRTRTSV